MFFERRTVGRLRLCAPISLRPICFTGYPVRRPRKLFPRPAGRETVAAVAGDGQRLMTVYDTPASICFPLRLTTWPVGRRTMTTIY